MQRQNSLGKLELILFTCLGSKTSMRSSTISTTFLCAPLASSAAFSGRTRTATRMLAGRGSAAAAAEVAEAEEEDASAVVEVAAS